MFNRSKQEVVVSEADIGTALDHLRTLPYRKAWPASWERQHLLNQLHEAIGRHPKINQCYDVAPGVFAIVKPFGVDLVSSGEFDGRLQVWLLIRPCGTDPNRLTRL